MTTNTTNKQTTSYTKKLNLLKNQVKRLNSRLAALQQLSNRYAQVRLAVFIGGAALVGFLFYLNNSLIGILGLILWLFGFGFAVKVHRTVKKSIVKHQIWLELKSTQIARIKLDWANIPATATGRTSATHPFARDLDLTGERSLHRLLDVAISREGSQRLKGWLLDTGPNLAVIKKRQQRIKTLVPLTLFRDKLTLSGMLTATGSGGWWQGERLLGWLKQQSNPQALRWVLILSAILAPLNIVLFGLDAVGLLPSVWIAPFAVYIALLMLKWTELAALFEQALTLQNGLKKLEMVFRHLETSSLERYPELADLCQPFLNPKNQPSNQLKKISRLVAAVGIAQNPLFGLVLNIIMPWNLYFAHRLNHYKDEIAHTLPDWLEVWVELEALSSLACFAYLNPAYVFPNIVNGPVAQQDGKKILFQGQALGHPLIANEQRICNDFVMTGPGDVDIITGSNMAGKSSFLRTIGVSLSLAYAGGPIVATSAEMSLFRLFTCINVSDSVMDGISYFYAEVKRLKALLASLDEQATLPLFYLIDEIFRGTNNRERYIGSRSYIKTLVGKNGVGLVATHDLELVKLADEIPQIKNYHFREGVTGGKMVFDYKLQPGPCPTTNALKIMALEGLPVDLE